MIEAACVVIVASNELFRDTMIQNWKKLPVKSADLILSHGYTANHDPVTTA